ncbi:MAG: NADP-dependent malic enzyme [Hyphomicrobiales bacterium]|nr:MAG: NADP-dependent malic enzyme [Hyphomicrobiales bacterium]
MSDKTKETKNDLDAAACFYHSYPRPGKLEIAAIKPLGNQRDLALAYSPGVAAPCLEIEKNPSKARDYTIRGNLVAVITNGTAVLGLGAIGPLASKPVMEGKAVLFKKFAGIDVFDIEVDETAVDKFVDVVAALEPTFGGINLEDISAPSCFEIEAKLRERMNIPVFHDDQHGTAIIVGAAVWNGMELAGKDLASVKIVASGAGAAALACLNQLLALGAKRENIWVTDIEGVVYEGRTSQMDKWKAAFAQDTDKRTLADVIDGADIFLGLSAAGVLKSEMVARMASKPLILALANPSPEIMPEEANSVRDDVMMCTGRSDYPNQVNNVLCFPYIFRGALDVGASTINEAMKAAAVKAIAGLAREEPDEVAAKAYGGDTHTFGPKYLIPSPFDQRLILRVAPAVARAAMETGVAERPITDFEAYNDRLTRFVFKSGLVMKPIVAQARLDPKRIIFADGEDERVLRAAQIALEDGIAQPILIGRPKVLEARVKKFGLRFLPGKDCEIIDPTDDPRFRNYVEQLLECVGRKGVNPKAAQTMVRTNNTVIGCLAVKCGDADALITGLEGRWIKHLRDVHNIIGKAEGVTDFSTLSLLINSQGAYFLTDSYVTENPSADEIVETTLMAVSHIKRFGISPKVALLSCSNFGSRDIESSEKMREAVGKIWDLDPDFEIDGEMHGDSALSEALRNRVMPQSRLSGEANLFVFPSLDASNISLNLIKVMTDALHVGPILLGAAKPAHILTPSVTSRGVLNMMALACVEAQQLDLEQNRIEAK